MRRKEMEETQREYEEFVEKSQREGALKHIADEEQ